MVLTMCQKPFLNPLHVLNAFNPHNDPMRLVLFLSLFYRGHGGFQ